MAAAYAVQERQTAARLAAGATVVGRKIGLTSPAVQAQLGVDQPDFGVLFDDMGYAEDETVPMSRLLQPKAEAEIAFVLGRRPGRRRPRRRPGAGARSPTRVAALEIVDSRVADWDIRFGDTVADNASSGLYVLGGERRTLDEVEPVDVEMSMTLNGERRRPPATARPAWATRSTPLAWLARKARDFGEPLRAGQVILSGALGPDGRRRPRGPSSPPTSAASAP